MAKQLLPNRQKFLEELRWICYKQYQWGQANKETSIKSETAMFKRLLKAAGFTPTESDIKYLLWQDDPNEVTHD